MPLASTKSGRLYTSQPILIKERLRTFSRQWRGLASAPGDAKPRNYNHIRDKLPGGVS
jgi:hypothetical protein